MLTTAASRIGYSTSNPDNYEDDDDDEIEQERTVEIILLRGIDYLSCQPPQLQCHPLPYSMPLVLNLHREGSIANEQPRCADE